MEQIINIDLKRSPVKQAVTNIPSKKYKSNDADTGIFLTNCHALTPAASQAIVVTPVQARNQNLKKTSTTMKTPSIGRLRTRQGIAFLWIGPPSPTTVNYAMGRVYFHGFSLGDKEYYCGDVVKLKTRYLNQTVRIVSAFQATRSFQGVVQAYGDDNFREIQKRGKYRYREKYEDCSVLI